MKVTSPPSLENSVTPVTRVTNKINLLILLTLNRVTHINFPLDTPCNGASTCNEKVLFTLLPVGLWPESLRHTSRWMRLQKEGRGNGPSVRDRGSYA